MGIMLKLPDDSVLTDEADIVRHLANEAEEAGWTLTLNPERIVQVFNETARDDDPATHIADIILALEGEQEAKDGIESAQAIVDATDAKATAATTKSVSINARMSYAHGFAAKSVNDTQFNDDVELTFKSAEHVRKSKLVLMLDLQRIHTDPATNRCEMDDWPRVPTTEEDKEVDLDPKQRSNNPFAYKIKRNNRSLTRDFAKDYFDRTAWGIKCHDARDAAAMEKEKLKAKGSHKATDMADIEDAIAFWDNRITRGGTAIRGAMILRQHLQRVRTELPKVAVVIHQNKAGRLADNASPIRLMPADAKGIGDVHNVSVAAFMSMDVDAAIAAGGTVDDLVATNNRGNRPEADGEETYPAVADTAHLTGNLFVTNTYAESESNTRMVYNLLNSTKKGEKTPTDASDILLFQIGKMHDWCYMIMANKEYAARYDQMVRPGKTAPVPKIKIAS